MHLDFFFLNGSGLQNPNRGNFGWVKCQVLNHR